MRTYVYIDGFNLYYGAVKNTPYKWLNVARMCELLLPSNKVEFIRYFTAHVSERPNHPQGRLNQQIYLRALRTLPNVSIHLGHFLCHATRMPLANPEPGGPRHAVVLKTEEKGSDVNLATYLLHDAYEGRFECAVVVTNDSDLLEPIRVVKEHLKLPVGIVNPHRHPSKQLAGVCTFMKKIRAGVLRASQFPVRLADDGGVFHRPGDWNA